MYNNFVYLVARRIPIRRGDILILVRVPKRPYVDCIGKSLYMMGQCDLLLLEVTALKSRYLRA